MLFRSRELYPEANITSIDYDPSATRVNQENRIKLMLSVGRERLAERTAGQVEAASASGAGTAVRGDPAFA